LEKYDTLDGIFAHLEEIPGKVGEKLKLGKDSAYLSQDLAKIRTDVGVRLVLEDARTDHINIPGVEALFRELEFRTLIPRLRMILTPLSQQTTPQLSLFGKKCVTSVCLPPIPSMLNELTAKKN
jgi:DNA polymerase-1